MNSRIPKIIHYCWFGEKEKPKKVLKCIKSWKKFLGDYQVIEWNESNFDIEGSSYVKQAYKAKKFAFVSDLARIYALKKFGGIYLDTDVELFKPLDDFLSNECFFGFEEKNFVATSLMAVKKDHFIMNEFLSIYNQECFINADGSFNTKTNVNRLTDLLMKKGLVLNGRHQILENGITVYPQDYFSPYDYINCVNKKTNNTYAIHHFYVSWQPLNVRYKKIIKRLVTNMFGEKTLEFLRKGS